MLTPRTVAICIPTCRRTDQLRRLLQSLQVLTFEKVLEPEITIIVVDNDPRLSARPVVAEFLSRRYRLRYRTESRPGVSYARNTAIEAGRAADFIAFLDDDQLAAHQWLDELLTAQSALDAAIVAGPILPRFESAPPAWLHGNAFFRGRRHATGTRLNSVAAGNVLISKQVFRALFPAWFDPRYSLTGGEDTQFFRRSAEAGFPVIWADDAIAYESIPSTRISREYLLSRARSGGNQWTRVELELSRGALSRGSRFAAGLVRIAQGVAFHIAAPVLSNAKRFRGELLLAEGMGNLAGFFGRSYELYGSKKL